MNVDAETSTVPPAARELRRLVRELGYTSETAADTVGMDRDTAALWLRLPDSQWPDWRGEPYVPLLASNGVKRIVRADGVPLFAGRGPGVPWKPPAVTRAAAAAPPAPAVPEGPLLRARRPALRAPLPAEDSAPSGEELAQRRRAVGITQRALAAACGVTRGLIAEVERGRRRHVGTRLKMAEILTQLTPGRGGVDAPQEAGT